MPGSGSPPRAPWRCRAPGRRFRLAWGGVSGGGLGWFGVQKEEVSRNLRCGNTHLEGDAISQHQRGHGLSGLYCTVSASMRTAAAEMVTHFHGCSIRSRRHSRVPALYRCDLDTCDVLYCFRSLSTSPSQQHHPPVSLDGVPLSFAGSGSTIEEIPCQARPGGRHSTAHGLGIISH